MPLTSEELLAPIAKAMTSGRYLIAAFRVERDPLDDEKLVVHLDRTTHDFPFNQFGEALLLLGENLMKVKRGILKSQI